MTTKRSARSSRLRLDARPQRLAAFLVTAAVPLMPSVAEAEDPPLESASRDSVYATLAAAVRELVSAHTLPGMTCALVFPDGAVIAVAAGNADVERDVPMRPSHVMPAGSIGKSFVAASVLALCADGVLDLDEPVARWLGERPWFANVPNASTITLRTLLVHSSGITGDYISTPRMEEAFAYSLDGFGGKDLEEQGITHDDFGAAIAGHEPTFAAGDSFGYSDSNYILAGLVIEAATGRDYYEFVSRRFTGPLDLDSIVPTQRHIDHLAAGYEPDETRLSISRRSSRMRSD